MEANPRSTSPLFGRLSAAGLVLAFAACAAEQRSVPEEVRWLVDHARYEDAVRTAAEASQRAPDDAQLADLHREATVAFLIEKGRRLTFKDSDIEALDAFNAAKELAPGDTLLDDWIGKTNAKLARRWKTIAFELHASEEIEPALTAYDNALKFAPNDPGALAGRAVAQAIILHHGVLGTTYFQDGLHALADYWLEQARSRFSYSRKYKPTDARTGERKTQVDTLLAIQRLALGRQYEADRRYGAARNEYRLCLALDPSNAEAKTSMARCKVEMGVAEKLKLVDMEIVRGRFGKADKLVEEAGAVTALQKDLVDGAAASIREARLSKAYGEALALERDFRFEEAVAGYRELLKSTEFYRDVITRRDTLDEYIRRASELYGKAEAADTNEKKLEYLNQIHVFWPEYKDIAQKIDELSTP